MKSLLNLNESLILIVSESLHTMLFKMSLGLSRIKMNVNIWS